MAQGKQNAEAGLNRRKNSLAFEPPQELRVQTNPATGLSRDSQEKD